MVGAQENSLFLANSRTLRGREGINLLVHACRSNFLYFFFSSLLIFPFLIFFFSFFLFFLILVFYFLIFKFLYRGAYVVVSCTQQGPLFIVPVVTGFTILALNHLCLVWVYLRTTTGSSICHSPSPDKRKLFCLFVNCGTLPCYGVSAFSFLIPHGMHLVVPSFASFGWYVIPAGYFPQKSSSKNL